MVRTGYVYRYQRFEKLFGIRDHTMPLVKDTRDTSNLASTLPRARGTDCRVETRFLEPREPRRALGGYGMEVRRNRKSGSGKSRTLAGSPADKGPTFPDFRIARTFRPSGRPRRRKLSFNFPRNSNKVAWPSRVLGPGIRPRARPWQHFKLAFHWLVSPNFIRSVASARVPGV